MAEDKAIKITKTTAAVLGIVLMLAGGVLRAVGCERGAVIVEEVDKIIDSPPLEPLGSPSTPQEPAPTP